MSRQTFRPSHGQKLKPGDESYIPEDRASDALQNLVEHYPSKFRWIVLW